ncbi:phosphoenolpyruvate synthase/pyruvate phosphate dikinase [Arthrobacter sp. B2I5]|uniref:hypothetical protein n=1 Tax=Arthrobacter sp. B2I5 TaxID=3042266 RepID=UPI00278B4045|nr:hypothetical protein [Arthrobacter sp. B2I5]MDQ0825433.1 phosphoenolpyruvate synthase/pyruvate phosphate dikinase [Arthrobacter sp. B2I5]
MGAVTNNDILNAIVSLTSEVASIKATGEATKAQAEKTNGRVNSIEDWKNGLMAVEQYKKEQQPTIKAGTVIYQQKWFQNEKLVGAVVAVLLAVAGAVGYVVGMPKG